MRNENDVKVINDKEALLIYGTNKNVNKMNNRRLKELKGEEFTVQAV